MSKVKTNCNPDFVFEAKSIKSVNVLSKQTCGCQVGGGEGRDGFGVSEIRVHMRLPSLLTIESRLEAACVIVRWGVAVPSSRGVSKDQRCP